MLGKLATVDDVRRPAWKEVGTPNSRVFSLNPGDKYTQPSAAGKITISLSVVRDCGLVKSTSEGPKPTTRGGLMRADQNFF